MQETLSKELAPIVVDVVVVNQTWPWQEEATKAKIQELLDAVAGKL